MAGCSTTTWLLDSDGKRCAPENTARKPAQPMRASASQLGESHSHHSPAKVSQVSVSRRVSHFRSGAMIQDTNQAPTANAKDAINFRDFSLMTRSDAAGVSGAP